MSLAAAAILAIVGLLLVLFTVGVLNVIGWVCLVVGAVCVVLALLAGRNRTAL